MKGKYDASEVEGSKCKKRRRRDGRAVKGNAVARLAEILTGQREGQNRKLGLVLAAVSPIFQSLRHLFLDITSTVLW